jgi:hypothetical protein
MLIKFRTEVMRLEAGPDLHFKFLQSVTPSHGWSNLWDGRMIFLNDVITPLFSVTTDAIARDILEYVWTYFHKIWQEGYSKSRTFYFPAVDSTNVTDDRTCEAGGWFSETTDNVSTPVVLSVCTHVPNSAGKRVFMKFGVDCILLKATPKSCFFLISYNR